MAKRQHESKTSGVASRSPPRKSTRYARVDHETRVIVKSDKNPFYDSTHCPICNQEPEDGNLYTHIQSAHKDLAITHAEDLANVKEGEVVTFVVKMQGVKVITFPPIYLSDKVPEEYIDDYGENYLTRLHTKLAGLDVTWGDGGFSINQPPPDRTIIEYFNDIASIFNLIGIPINFFNQLEIIQLGKFVDDSAAIDLIRSQTAVKVETKIVLSELEFPQIILPCWVLWDNIMKNPFLMETRVYEYLARSRLSLFKLEYSLSLSYSWIAIEAILRDEWEKMIIEKHGSKTAAKNVLEDKRAWTAFVMTEELYLSGKLTKEEKEEIDYLRQARNDLFHISGKPKKDRNPHRDSWRGVIMGLKLLYKILNLDKDKIFDFKDIRERIWNAIHSPEHVEIVDGDIPSRLQ